MRPKNAYPYEKVRKHKIFRHYFKYLNNVIKQVQSGLEMKSTAKPWLKVRTNSGSRIAEHKFKDFETGKYSLPH